MSIHRFRSLLIANRGEIAVRIARACRRLGIRAVAVYSDADREACHVREADVAVYIGPSPAAQSYLNVGAILDAARRAGADAIHPGYGFLAEDAAFAQACRDAGMVFVGPSAEAVAAMGNKRAARELAARLGLPVAPGYDGGAQDDETLRREAFRIGYPVMVKAAAGGGGKGMRQVNEPDELPDALSGARREALQAFGSDELLLERALRRPRHIEVQILADAYGRTLHLGERECSVQRRHQKVIEETPSPAVTPDLRARLGRTAVTLAQAIGYTNAGTVEFLLDEDGRYYFLEMNTRLQVEHPVTELVTGLDLVEWQIRVAEGEPLPWDQDGVRLHGHAIEARLYAEDPANGYLPTTGDVLLWRPPAGEGIRVDAGIQTGDSVTVHYDPLLAKIIAFGEDRALALRRLRRALETTVLLGLTHNGVFLQAILAHPAFQAGELSVRFLEERFDEMRVRAGDVSLALIVAALAEWFDHPRPAIAGEYWRNNPYRPARYGFRLLSPTTDVERREVLLNPRRGAGDRFSVSLSAAPESEHEVVAQSESEHDWIMIVDGYRRGATLAGRGSRRWVMTDGGVVVLEALDPLPAPGRAADAGGSLRAPMPGTVLAVLVEVGQPVEAGQALLKLEAMKMEHTIRAAAAGVIEAVYFRPGDAVDADALLCRIGPQPAERDQPHSEANA